MLDMTQAKFLVCHVSGVADDRSQPENPLRQCGCQLDILHFVHVAVILFHLDQSLIDGNHILTDRIFGKCPWKSEEK